MSPQRRFLIFTFFLISNYWIWEIIQKNLFLGLCLTVNSLLFYRVFFTKRNKTKLFFISLLILGILQFSITDRVSPLYSTALERDLQIKRMNAYVGSFPRLGYPLEMKKEIVGLYKMQANLVDYFDINYYFFGSYPRSLQKPGEFEKFPFFFFPLFLFGIYKLIKEHTQKLITYTAFFAFLIAIIGDKSHLGLLVNFPLIIIAETRSLIK